MRFPHSLLIVSSSTLSLFRLEQWENISFQAIAVTRKGLRSVIAVVHFILFTIVRGLSAVQCNIDFNISSLVTDRRRLCVVIAPCLRRWRRGKIHRTTVLFKTLPASYERSRLIENSCPALKLPDFSWPYADRRALGGARTQGKDQFPRSDFRLLILFVCVRIGLNGIWKNGSKQPLPSPPAASKPSGDPPF